MVQRKAATKAKGAANGVQKKTNAETPKKTLKNKLVEAVEEEEEEVVTTPQKKKAAGKKTPAKAAPPPPVEEESDEDSDEEEINEQANVANESGDEDDSESEEQENGENQVEKDDEDDSEEEEIAEGFVENEAEESDDEDDSEDADNAASEQTADAAADSEDDDSDEDGEDAPEEAPIVKATAKKGIPQIVSGKIPAETPKDQLLYIAGLPLNYKYIDFVETFVKFGTINVIDRSKLPGKRDTARIAYASADSVEAALAADKITLDDKVLNVSRAKDNKDDSQDRDGRTVVISCLGPVTKAEQLKEHFAECGEIVDVTFSKNKNCPYGFVRFANAESVSKAIKLNNSTLNDRILGVRSKAHTVEKTSERTIVVTNTIDAESYNSDEISKIFKKCGEIVDLEVLCTKSTLAFVSFKTEEAAQKAYALNGKTVNNLELKLEHYESSVNRSILVTNLAQDTTEIQLTVLFSKSGEVEHVKVFPKHALIKFKTTDGFCKSFLLNETVVNGKPIFLEPNSKLKLKLKSRPEHFGGPNRRNGGPGGNFNNKRPGGPGGNFNNKRPGGPGGNFNKNRSPGGPGGKRPAGPGGKRPGSNDNTPHFFKRAKTA